MVAGLIALILLAWAYLITEAGSGAMTGMDGMAPSPGWLLTAAMWAAMMIAMMMPSAAPAILLFTKVHRHTLGPSIAPPATAILAGYLACWLGFAALAATLQQLLGNMMVVGRVAAAALLIAAGLYQLSPLKDACLTRCRSPALFLARHYRPGASGAVQLGLLHGVYCVGCCWLLMSLLFVGGVMNLAWIAALTLLVAAEKLLPRGQWIARISGIVFIGWGLALLSS
jgi:predicted metal-binding membrane protein